VNQVAPQLTRLMLGGVQHLSTLEPCVPGLAHNLQRLERPSLELPDVVITAMHQLPPGPRCVEFGRLSLSSSHADADCGWQELRLGNLLGPAPSSAGMAPSGSIRGFCVRFPTVHYPGEYITARVRAALG
jgi:hypothetical protein